MGIAAAAFPEKLEVFKVVVDFEIDDTFIDELDVFEVDVSFDVVENTFVELVFFRGCRGGRGFLARSAARYFGCRTRCFRDGVGRFCRGHNWGDVS